MKKFNYLFILLAAGIMATGCTTTTTGSGDEPTGASTWQWGTDADYDVATTVYMQFFGGTNIAGLYVTCFNFRIHRSVDQSVPVHCRIVLFHNSKSFVPGTYAFPSSGNGTAAGNFSIPGDEPKSGEINGGSVTVSVSGDTYTITLNDATVRGHMETVSPLDFIYSGSVYRDDMSGEPSSLQPEFPGTGNMKDEISGKTFTAMGMEVFYLGLTKSTNKHRNMLRLTSENDGDGLHADFELYTDTRDFTPGAYTAAADSTAMTFNGQILLYGETGVTAQASVTGGKIQMASSNGVYTITVGDVSAEGYDGSEIELAGTYTGICNYFHDVSDK